MDVLMTNYRKSQVQEKCSNEENLPSEMHGGQNWPTSDVAKFFSLDRICDDWYNSFNEP